MKNKFSILTGILLIFFSCVNDESEFIEKNNIDTTITRESEGDSIFNIIATVEDAPATVDIPLQELIIQYYPNTSEEAKEALRDKYDVVSHKVCDCSGGSKIYELWKMGPQILIEPTAKVIKTDDEEEVEFVAPNYGFNIPMTSALTNEDDSLENYYSNNDTSTSNFLNKIVPSNTGVSIAVLDTGIDPNLAAFSSPFLYNSSQNGLCNEISGWDFVNGDNYPYDDYKYKHGSVISYIIHDELNKRGIANQILPVKIADDNGQSTLFTALCGLKHAIDVDVEVINLSFAWTHHDPHAYDMFGDLISKTSAIIVCSAGNEDKDNDVSPHYPSNFPHNHVISVAAAEASLNNSAGYSNFGDITVDYYAKGNKIYFPLGSGNNRVIHNGTSFATPLLSARVAELISNNFSNMRAELSQQFAVPIEFDKPVFYMQLIQ